MKYLINHIIRFMKQFIQSLAYSRMRKHSMNLTAIFEESKEGGFTCWIEEMPEVVSEGDTLNEAKKNLIEALKLVLEYRREEYESVSS